MLLIWGYHNDDTVDQRKVLLPEHGKRTIIEGFMGEEKGTCPSSVPLVMQ